ncbi:3-hydroxyisobutyrate dehydrogenase [Nesterenkonia sp. HG001]|uniref:3-hydroxyisobutyrate dehydrogenase n=1 Tax=Nesterenkonia sp. HG001 TaxID=2983207 RepID=UPI002AC6E185|nr:3-hydroxyisobutyrate dehydrogenase [Nesterenkonia sp. HG001]MDZ5077480.1 3-hydroxyisobutyrate dehydrogenase [Nesterenkonia sp. HG001]
MAVYGWIGLGNMGGPMTRNLVAAGHTVRGFDLDSEAVSEAAAHGVETVGSIAEVVAGADVVFTMLPRGEHVRAVFGAEDGIWATAETRTLLVDSSTVDVETSQHCHDLSAQHGFRFVDAPVSGGISGATAATLAFMVGGEDEAVREATAHIQPMAGTIIAAGAATAGIAAKICNNMMLFIDLMAASEGSQLAEQLSLDPKVFWEIASVSSGRSWAQQTWYPMPGIVESSAANRNYDATFRADLALKDVSLALDAGERTGVKLQAAQLAQQRFEQLIDEGFADKDCSLIVKYSSPDGGAPGWDGSGTSTTPSSSSSSTAQAAPAAQTGKA